MSAELDGVLSFPAILEVVFLEGLAIWNLANSTSLSSLLGMYLLPGVPLSWWAVPGVLVIADELLLVEGLDLEGVLKLLPGVLQVRREGVEKGSGEFILKLNVDVVSISFA